MQKKAEGGLNLENFASLSRGGDSGTIIDPKAGDKSILLERVTGRVEPIMPPIDNTVDAKPLSADQIAIVKRWIESGAMSKASTLVGSSDYHPLPVHIQASYAMTVTQDGEWLVYARGNDLVFHPINDWSNLAATAPQQLRHEDAHRDFCFSMAASPDGQRIASGSTGEVKIWRKHVAGSVLISPSPETSPNSPLAPPLPVEGEPEFGWYRRRPESIFIWSGWG